MTMASELPEPASHGYADLPDSLGELARRSLVCEYATLTRDGRPVTWPLTPYPGESGATVDVSTGLTYPLKAERARHDPRVALLFSSTSETQLPGAPTVLIQGLATVRDADLQANTDRYVRESRAKMPQAYQGMPTFLLRRLNWYLARIWVQVTPLRVLTWSGGRLDRAPQRWEAPAGTTAPPSDPPPRGRSLPSRSVPPADWRPFAARAERLGVPVVTVVGADGWPLPVRCRSVQRAPDGYVLQLPAGVSASQGPACVTAHWYLPDMTNQENVVLVGTAEPAGDDRIAVRIERALTDWSLVGSRVGRTRGFLAQRKALTPRLQTEADRRGQAPPLIRL